MSIIEKAVNALGKSPGGDKSRQSAARGAAARTGSTIERKIAEVTRQVQPLTPGDINARIRQEGAANVLGQKYLKINFDELQQIGILTPSVPRSVIAEEFRTIKRPLLANIAGDETEPPLKFGNLIMVTSALDGDGKTFVSLSLAISIAMEQDKTVLFVDANTARAEAGPLLGIPAGCPGLTNVLEDDGVAVADVVLRTNLDKLRILPSGDLHANANELLASDRMRHLMTSLSEEDPDQVIIFDSPPLLLASESAVLAGFMGQLVFVVSAEVTPQHAVKQAIEYIEEDKMVGLVLNRARHTNPYFYRLSDEYGYGRKKHNNTELEAG